MLELFLGKYVGFLGATCGRLALATWEGHDKKSEHSTVGKKDTRNSAFEFTEQQRYGLLQVIVNAVRTVKNVFLAQFWPVHRRVPYFGTRDAQASSQLSLPQSAVAIAHQNTISA